METNVSLACQDCRNRFTVPIEKYVEQAMQEHSFVNISINCPHCSSVIYYLDNEGYDTLDGYFNGLKNYNTTMKCLLGRVEKTRGGVPRKVEITRTLFNYHLNNIFFAKLLGTLYLTIVIEKLKSWEFSVHYGERQLSAEFLSKII